MDSAPDWRWVAVLVLLVAGCSVRPPAEVKTVGSIDVNTTNLPAAQDNPPEEITTPTPAPTGPRDSIDIPLVQRLVVSELNKHRSDRLTTVLEDQRLSIIAGRKSYEMATEGYFAHERPDGGDMSDRLKKAGFQCGELSEILLKTYWNRTLQSLDGGSITDESTLAAEIIDGFADSPAHQQAMLGPEYGTVGVGIYITESGVVYVTLVLCEQA